MDGERSTRAEDSRRRHTDAFKQALVERSLVPGASVAAIAQDAGINANLLFNWRRVTSRRNPATRSRHIPASWRGAEVHLEALF